MNLTGKTCGPWKVIERASARAWMCLHRDGRRLAVAEESLLALRAIEARVEAELGGGTEQTRAHREAIRERDQRKKDASAVRARQLDVTKRTYPKRHGSFVLLPLRRLASEPRLPDRGHHQGWPESFDPTGLLGDFNEGRALCRSREVAERAAKRAERLAGRLA